MAVLAEPLIGRDAGIGAARWRARGGLRGYAQVQRDLRRARDRQDVPAGRAMPPGRGPRLPRSPGPRHGARAGAAVRDGRRRVRRLPRVARPADLQPPRGGRPGRARFGIPLAALAGRRIRAANPGRALSRSPRGARAGRAAGRPTAGGDGVRRHPLERRRVARAARVPAAASDPGRGPRCDHLPHRAGELRGRSHSRRGGRAAVRSPVSRSDRSSARTRCDYSGGGRGRSPNASTARAAAIPSTCSSWSEAATGPVSVYPDRAARSAFRPR